MASVYSQIATHFSETRYKPWPGVVDFLNSIPAGSTVLDLGCGNGKYLSVRKDLNLYACDACPELVAIARSKHPHCDVLIADGCALPYATASMDFVFSIAVFHHISVDQRRTFLNEVRRVLKPDGQFFLTVWAPSAVRPNWTPRGKGDFDVPWHDKYSQQKLQRPYHIFQINELQSYLSLFEILKSCEEKSNWYILCQKK